MATAGGAICSGANSAYTQYTLTGDIDGGKVLSDTILGGVSNGLSTGMSEVLKPVVKGLSEGITHTVGQVAREIGMGIINVGQFVIDNLLPTAITGFGAWIGGLAYDFSLSDKYSKNKFFCVPIASDLPVTFLILLLIELYWMVYGLKNNQTDLVFIFGAMAALCLVFILFFSEKALQHVVLFHDCIECKGVHFKSSFCLKYDQCNIGIERHIQYGNSIWWIYFCDGPLWRYKGKNTKNKLTISKSNTALFGLCIRKNYTNHFYRCYPKGRKLL